MKQLAEKDIVSVWLVSYSTSMMIILRDKKFINIIYFYLFRCRFNFIFFFELLSSPLVKFKPPLKILSLINGKMNKIQLVILNEINANETELS